MWPSVLLVLCAKITTPITSLFSSDSSLLEQSLCYGITPVRTPRFSEKIALVAKGIYFLRRALAFLLVGVVVEEDLDHLLFLAILHPGFADRLSLDVAR